MLFKCSNIVQSRFLLQVEPCKGKVFKCLSVAALLTHNRSWCRTADFSNASTTARFEKRDVDIFFAVCFQLFYCIDLAWANANNRALVCAAGYSTPRPAVVVHALLLFAVVVQPSLLLFCCSCSNT